MFEKAIEFSAQEDYFALKEDYPTPIKLNIPEWYKKLEHSIHLKTIKGCMPFLDTLTSGYLLKIPQDFYVRHNIINEKGEKDSFQTFGLFNKSDELHIKKINLNSRIDSHFIKQVEGSPLIEKNKNLPFYKIANPWKIKTPKGYSCLFVPPLNNADDRFSIIPGIVDTDTFPNEINFPITINGDKYPVLEDTIKKGTPYVQIIPFKRDNWKMTLKTRKQEEIQNSRLFYELRLLNKYKDKFWKKKLWK
jgi:hypothetical protein